MNTNKFRTRQEFMTRTTHPKGKKFIIGLDAGYSAMKVFYENGYFCFPSYARKLEHPLNSPDPKDILYHDKETNEIYLIGYSAQEMINSTETNDTESEMNTRKRYGQKRFRILCDAALAIASSTRKDDREIVVQTGLPASYLDADKQLMVNALSKPAKFDLKIGSGPWRSYEFNLDKKNIFVDLPQPAGALYSVLIRDDGTYAPYAKKYLQTNTLVMDIGFVTFDFYGIKNRAMVCNESNDTIGMWQVLRKTSKKINEELGEEVRVPSMQKYLSSGKIVCVNEEELCSEEHSISEYVQAANDETFKEAMEQAKAITGAFRDYNQVILAGGTGEAWYEKVVDYLKGMKQLTVIPCNVNDHLPFIYSISRGYYMYRYDRLKKAL